MSLLSWTSIKWQYTTPGFEFDFNIEEDTTSEISTANPDIELSLDNLVEDIDINQHIKYIYNSAHKDTNEAIR